MRYQKIYCQIWNDKRFSTLSPSPQRLYLYVFTCPHGNIIGMFVLKQGYICDDLKCSPKDLAKDLAKLIEKGMVEYDFATSVIMIPEFLKHNPITNPNQVKAARKMIQELPHSPLFQRFMEVLPEALKEALGEVLLKPEYISVSDSVSVSEEGGAGGRKPTAEEKRLYGEFVLLTDAEHQKLVTQFGEQGTKDRIETLDNAIGSKGYRYKSHYHTILSWERKNAKSEVQKPLGGLAY